MGDIGLSTQTAPIRTRDDAAGWLAAVLDGLDLTRPTLIGSSFGGFHSTNLAVARPDRVGGLVLLAPAATILPFRRVADLMIRAGSLVPLPFTVRPGLRAMISGGAPNGRIVDEMEAGVAGFRYDRGGIYPSELSDDDLASIACPTLVLLGDKEMIYDPVAAIARARRLIPRIDTEIVQDVGHLLGMQRPGVVRRIRAFLTAQTGAVPTGRVLELQPA